jgi:hypothetical protein
VVREERHALTKPHLTKVAIAPFDPAQAAMGAAPPDERAAREAADLVTRSFAEALAAEGVALVPATDVRIALGAAGIETPSVDPASAAQSVARKFSASAVALGRLDRYRDRGGTGAGAATPASVSFEVNLYAAPNGKQLWAGRFSHTQQSLDYRPLEAARLPGRGMRWLSAAELARWGAGNLARALVASP